MNTNKKKNFGGWSIDEELFNEIKRLVKPRGRILEFGSGDATTELLKLYHVTSVEHDEKYSQNRGYKHKVFLCPLKEGWYNLPAGITGTILDADLILVDGPPSVNRANIVKNLHYFAAINCPVIFDDVHRQTDFDAMVKFCEELNYNFVIISTKNKAFAVCNWKLS